VRASSDLVVWGLVTGNWGLAAGVTIDGHWIAFHLQEHDIHHRADVLHHLALLGIAALTSLNF
jgi:hypothetical protein